ncbi:MAG: hypothetical protein EOP00_14005 [Pedobacter sp.]|nr:MAG: hypothetical protein EOP00_14005 [Pedobacter sp.]
MNAQENKTIRYFNTKNKEITEKKFKEIRSTNKVLDIIGDSTNHRKLIERDETGNIDRNKLVSALENAINKKIDSNSIIVILYYPGQDPCNSSGNPPQNEDFYTERENEIKRLAKATILYVYKDFKGLERFKNHKKYIQDPENIVEKLFFKHHYPCHSFAVISKTGAYRSYFGEYPTSFLLEDVKSLNK